MNLRLLSRRGVRGGASKGGGTGGKIVLVFKPVCYSVGARVCAAGHVQVKRAGEVKSSGVLRSGGVLLLRRKGGGLFPGACCPSTFTIPS